MIVRVFGSYSKDCLSRQTERNYPVCGCSHTALVFRGGLVVIFGGYSHVVVVLVGFCLTVVVLGGCVTWLSSVAVTATWLSSLEVSFSRLSSLEVVSYSCRPWKFRPNYNRVG